MHAVRKSQPPGHALRSGLVGQGLAKGTTFLATALPPTSLVRCAHKMLVYFYTLLFCTSSAFPLFYSNSGKTLPTRPKLAKVDKSFYTEYQKNVLKSFPENVIQRNAGAGWKMINFSDTEIEGGICDVVHFTSTTGASAKMCVHKGNDFVSDSIRRTKRWPDCDPLPRHWNALYTGAENDVYEFW